jgi:hypothetical protein
LLTNENDLDETLQNLDFVAAKRSFAGFFKGFFGRFGFVRLDEIVEDKLIFYFAHK